MPAAIPSKAGATMTDAMLSFAEIGQQLPLGYRLKRVELLNWGTFDGRVWTLTPDGDTSLLTGDIGSGKSTLVDAITTLLLPAHKVAYNKAAGADSKERTLRSYVEGHFKSERNETTGTSRAVGLRNHNSYTVIVGVFANAGYEEQVTLAQVFHQADRSGGQPDRFFVTASRELSIGSDFTGFGSDLRELRRQLRSSGAEISNVFPEYANQFRKLLGIRSEQAMELFHQTVSMKSVGNLDDFVRDHMLEPADAGERVKAIVTHFEDLNSSYEAVKRAEEQLAALTPLIDVIDRYETARSRQTEFEGERDAVTSWAIERRLTLLESEAGEATALRTQRRAEWDDVGRELADAAHEREQLSLARQSAGGDRLAQLDHELRAAEAEESHRADKRQRFDSLVTELELPPVTTAADHAATVGQLDGRAATLKAERQQLDEQIVELRGQLGELRRELAGIDHELSSLNQRSNNLPREQVEVREQLSGELGIPIDELPFAGELVDVAEDRAEWRGAAERVMRSFALSMLVPQRHYDQVSRWVNGRRLSFRRHGDTVGARLSYERVSERRLPLVASGEPGRLTLSDCLITREGEFAGYLAGELIRRGAYSCVDTIEEFQSEDRAVTREGQIKRGERHEKDDRTRTDDPRSWVLGWANERKKAAIETRRDEVESATTALDQQLVEVERQRARTSELERPLFQLGEYRTWTELDVEASASRRVLLEAERDRLRAGSSQLAEIETRIEQSEALIEGLTRQRSQLDQSIGGLNSRIERAEVRRQADKLTLAGETPERLERHRNTYPAIERRAGARMPNSVDECDRVADQLRKAIDDQLRQVTNEIGAHTTNMQRSMGDIKNRWPDATSELDASPEARHEFRQLHRRVMDDDLPKYTSEFEHQLTTNTIRELAGLNSWLRRQSDEIRTRVETINHALGALDYSPGRYIRLEPTATSHSDVVDFRRELRNATDDALTPDDDHYSEQRFLQVKKIIERFRGREGHAQRDKDWTRLVTDVRHWFTFSASERDRHTDEEWEHYRDSDGKSGGQKEKLAYTILAASLAYQFGLTWGADISRDFRFAVIDEAFGRGSDASTRYALELFAKLDLQLLIVTPLQKVNVIAPYVQSIGFVDNPTGRASRVQMLTIEEFRERRLEPR